MQRTNINPAIFQDMLDCASNASAIGQSQFFTPPDFGALLAILLPDFRPEIVDLNCGNGQLLHAAANATTKRLFGLDIDPAGSAPGSTRVARVTPHRITGDLTRVYPLFVDVDWRFNLGVFNPPWSLHFYRERLAALAESELASVRQAFAAKEPQLGPDLIDSTAAVAMMALDRMSGRGEAFLIGNADTLERLILREDAPYHALAEHVWASFTVNGNPMTGGTTRVPRVLTSSPQPTPSNEGAGELCQCPRDAGATQREAGATQWDSQFRTGIIYFARQHHSGPARDAIRSVPDLTSLETVLRQAKQNRLFLRKGAEMRESACYDDESAVRWEAVAGEWRSTNVLGSTRVSMGSTRVSRVLTSSPKPTSSIERAEELGQCPRDAGATHAARTDYNLWLRLDGTIAISLNLYDQKSSRRLKAEADQLHHLQGKRPMQLIMQRSEREILLNAVGSVAGSATVPVAVSGVSPETGFRAHPVQRAELSQCPPEAGATHSPWRIDPKLAAAVREAIQAYHSCRAPLYPLPELQRLGYLDEEDWIVCKKSLGSTRVSRVLTSSPQSTPSSERAGELGQCPRDAGATQFHAGQRYALRTQSVQITRRGVRPSLTGEPEEIEYTGQELAMLITDATGVERVFMEARLRDPKITVHPISIDGGARPSRSPSPASRRRRGSAPAQSSGPFQIDFTLQELAAHFIIPEVADVAAMDPEGFERNLRALEELEGVLGG